MGAKIVDFTAESAWIRWRLGREFRSNMECRFKSDHPYHWDFL